MKDGANILRILKEAKRLIESGDAPGLKKLSEQTIQSATISQDADHVIVTVLIYSIGKIIEREHYHKMEGWKEFYNSLIENLKNAISCLENENPKECRLYLGKIRNSLNKISGDLSRYIKSVFRKAEINKAFRLYEHGLSSEKTAEILGVSLWDLASYIGQSSISDAKISVSLPVKQRIKIAEDIFR